jgi:hypothetical protein
MIVYNVTCNVEKPMADEWLNWMKTVHIPEVMATGCFSEFKILRLINQDGDDQGVNYAIQYTCDSEKTLEHYRATFGPSLMAKTWERYGERVVAYRSVLEIID